MDIAEIMLPKEYAEYINVFLKEDAAKLPDHVRIEYTITIKEGKESPYRLIYILSAIELRILNDYLKSNIIKGWIYKSESLINALILFIKKKDNYLRLYINYRGLNKITIKNRYPLLLINETLNRLYSAVIFTKLDLRDIYH